jgi:HAE1 family hydrophobic/amphiphilic exporter-1
MYQQFALTIAISVIISAINALTLSPALSALLLRPGTSKGWLGRFFAAFNRGFDAVTSRYTSWTAVAVRRGFHTVVILVVLTAAALLLGWRLPTGFVPDEDQGYMFVNVQLPDAASMERTDASASRSRGSSPTQESATSTRSPATAWSRRSATYKRVLLRVIKPWRDARPPTRRGHPGGAEPFAQSPRHECSRSCHRRFGHVSGGGFTFMLQDRSGGDVTTAQNLAKFLRVARKRPDSAFSAVRASVPGVRRRGARQGPENRAST